MYPSKFPEDELGQVNQVISWFSFSAHPSSLGQNILWRMVQLQWRMHTLHIMCSCSCHHEHMQQAPCSRVASRASLGTRFIFMVGCPIPADASHIFTAFQHLVRKGTSYYYYIQDSLFCGFLCKGLRSRNCWHWHCSLWPTPAWRWKAAGPFYRPCLRVNENSTN